MEIQLNNIDFAIAVNTFSDDVEQKLQILTKMEWQFLRKFEHRVQISQYHSEMVFQIRNIVSAIEEMYKDVREYFVDMKVEFVYEFMRKIQTLMVIGYNHLSQALLITFDMYEEQRNKSRQAKPAVVEMRQTKKDHIMSREEFRRLEYIDYTIKSLESEEGRLMNQMVPIYDRMMLQKGLIQKVKPSLAAKELGEMKDHIQMVIEHNQKLFEETYLMKFFEFHNHIQKLDKPEQITQVYNDFNLTLKQNFIDLTLKAAKRIEHDRRHNPSRMRDAQVQTTDPKTKQKDSLKGQSISILRKTTTAPHLLLAKQKKLNQKMNIELNMLQRQNMSLNEELNLYKSAQKQIQIKYRELVQKFQAVQGMYCQTKMELDDVKRQEQFQMHQLIVQNNKVKQQLAALRGKGSFSSSTVVNTCKVYVQTDKIVRRPDSSTKSQNFIAWNQYSGEDKETQTHEEYLLPVNDDEIIRLLKTRNEKAMTMLNEKDRKIRDTATKIAMVQKENTQIKSTLNIFLRIVQEKVISSKYQPNDLPNTYQPPQSILEMNSQQIQTKIKKVIQMIVPNDFDSQNNDFNPPQQVKFKKVTSIGSKPFQTLCNQQLGSQNSNQEFFNAESGNTFSKTSCNFASDSLDQKKKKRLNFMGFISEKRKLNQITTDIQCQTQAIFNQREYCHCQSIQGHYNQGHFIDKKQGSLKNSETKEMCAQTMIDSKNQRGHSRKKSTIQKSIEARNQKAQNGKRPSKSRGKHETNSNGSSQRVIWPFEKKSFEKKFHLNSFEKFKIQGKQNSTERFSFSRSLGRTGLSEYLQSQHKMAQTSPMTWRNSPDQNRGVQTQQGLRAVNASGLFQDFPAQANSGIMHRDERQNKQGDLRMSLTSSRLDASIGGNKGFSVRQKSTLQKGNHKRFATSQLPARFRPITETSQCDKENQTSINGCMPTNATPKSFFNNIENSDKLDSIQNPQFCTTPGSQFSKFKGQQIGSPKMTRKKQTLLLSIQTFRPKESKTNDILLERYLARIIHKWGKDKINHAISSLLKVDS